MKLAIVGGRDFNDYDMLTRSVADIEGVDLIISGRLPKFMLLADGFSQRRFKCCTGTYLPEIKVGCGKFRLLGFPKSRRKRIYLIAQVDPFLF